MTNQQTISNQACVIWPQNTPTRPTTSTDC